jgi:predicted nucleotidyltransferase
MTTGLLDPEASRFKVEIVMDENKVVSGEHEFSEQAFERRTSDVHPVEGAGEFEEF